MRIVMFSAKSYERQVFSESNAVHGHELILQKSQLNRETAMLAKGSGAVCAFVNDELDAPVIHQLADGGTKLIAMRCAGFNNVDLEVAESRGVRVVRVPAYSPHAVAEHTLAIILCLNRRIHRAFNRIREGNFALEGLTGFDLFGKTAGVVGTGTIGRIVAKILLGFGCSVVAHDVKEDVELQEAGVSYVPLPALFTEADIISLHCPLMPETRHLINQDSLAQMKDGVMLVNTSRGALLNTVDVIAALKSRKLGYLGLDVYEEEEHLFFRDLSDQVITDDIFSRLLTFPNVLITGHQAFLTDTALRNIAETTLQNLSDFEQSAALKNEITATRLKT